MVVEFTKQNKSILNKEVIVTKNYLEEAYLIMKGIYKIQKGLDEIHFNKKIDWNYKHEISSNTYQLYLHTLNFNNALVKTYLNTNDIKYIAEAKNIIEDWIKVNIDQKESTKFVWYDHTVSSRLQNLLYFQTNAPIKYKIRKRKFLNVFEQHLEFLVKYKNYTENNHGIMMDRALVVGSLFLEDEELKNEYLMLAKNRIEKAILRDYSYKNVHLENSPDYHRMVTNWLNKVVKLFDDVKMPLSLKYKNKLKGADLYNGIVVNYNKEYPMVGDTAHGITNIRKQHKNFVDYEAGIGVFNDRNTESTLVFNCGFKNLTHKHKDDLSMTLSIEKEQLLIDSGKYNYNQNDIVRKYMLSAEAHSTIFVLNKDYNLKYDSKIEITSSYIHKDYKVLQGLHKGYEGITLERTIIFLNEALYIIVDKASSNEENTYVQNFVLDNKVKLENLKKRKYLLTTASKKQYILQEHSPVAASKIFYGQNSNAMVSKSFNRIEETSRIEIRKKQPSSIFISSISPVSMQVDSIELEDGSIKINANNQMKTINIS